VLISGTPAKQSTNNAYTSLDSTTRMSSPLPRLLYRGALSLPDSLLLLDGLTFTTSSRIDLLHNKLALALESMRGRPSLRFLGLTKLRDVWMEEAGDVCL
jgi:hypothetical protein